MDVNIFKKLPVLGILRGVDINSIEPLVEAAKQSGLKALEITMNTPNAPDAIKRARRVAGNDVALGAGTVVSERSLKLALDAGASFIVMPVLIKKIVCYCVKNKIPVFPGALSPQEIYDAWTSGATMVKVFPSNFFGPDYFKEIKGPFDDIKLLACGGVTPENAKAYFASGADAIAFGAGVFRKEWIAKKDYASIARCIKEYLSAAKNRP
jgi:2-dehydro-3-deoxyphosphogluconate aldolase/(4S)-4-hydroxy-2-oxoglutarate aldolase